MQRATENTLFSCFFDYVCAAESQNPLRSPQGIHNDDVTLAISIRFNEIQILHTWP